MSDGETSRENRIQSLKEDLKEVISGATPVAANEWYHLAGVVDSKGNVKLYLNGEQAGSGNSRLTHADIDLFVGTRHPNGGGGGIKDPFPGLLDEVAIFN